jgi:hypothetical protein
VCEGEVQWSEEVWMARGVEWRGRGDGQGECEKGQRSGIGRGNREV